MFLATTADERFWKTDEKVLFLGEWCRLYSQKQVWSKLDHEVLPYHWDDREKLYQDYQLLDQVYESCLVQLTAKLNDLHEVDYPLRYWRIVIGPWLFNFIEILYDRYLSLIQARDSGKVTHTLVASWGSAQWLAKDISVFKSWALKDPFNHFLYAEIIRFLKEVPYETLDIPPAITHEPPAGISSNPAADSARKLLRKLAGLIPDSLNRVVFVNSYIKPLALGQLQASLGQLPYPYPPMVKTVTLPVNKNMREQLHFEPGPTRFETLLEQMIQNLMPTVYVEGYQNMHEQSLEAFPAKPDLIYTTSALIEHEGFKFWSAWHTMRGTKLIASPHGGHYGTSQWSAQESHEVKVSDHYFTWGWEDTGDPRLIPMSSAQIASRVGNLQPRTEGIILWVGMMVPRYSYWMYSIPVGAQTLDYFEDQKRFSEAVSSDARDLLVYRMPEHDFGWDQKKRLGDLIPSLKLYDGKMSFYQQLEEARLCINTCNSTPYLETFSANFPTLIFWNPQHWELRPSVRPYFDEMREAGILHDTPESAAAKIDEIYQNPQAWWSSPEIQKVRQRFCDQFARTSPQWLAEWKKELQKLTGK